MLHFPPAKLNLGLNVIERRADGYHELESIMVPVPIHDALEIMPDLKSERGHIELEQSGITIPGTDNLCVRAYERFSELRPIPSIRACLYKKIPIGAGLGGGSSDCAHMLRMLNKVAENPLNVKELHELAAELGSDVPFFLEDSAQLVQGTGNVLNPIELHLNGIWGVIVNPGIHISTSEAYQHTDKSGAVRGFEKISSLPFPEWKNVLFNSMEGHAIREHPVIGSIKKSLQAAGAELSLMSGSGSSVFGLFGHKPPRLSWPDDYSVWGFKF
jgi:4-diphosphocytidyl-2-C-methyl-D-erythritol kinase